MVDLSEFGGSGALASPSGISESELYPIVEFP